jgi:hypothetical protein
MLTRDQVLEDADATIWRYMTVQKLIDLLTTSELHFARIDQFRDHHEAAISRPAFERNMAEAYARMDAEGWTGNAEERRYRALLREAAGVIFTRMEVFACCWHKVETESSLMWANYADKGVSIKSTIGRLASATPPPPLGPPVHVHPVIYVEHDSDDMDFTESFLHKLRLYQDERELRAFVFLPEAQRIKRRPPENPKYQRIPCDLSTLLVSVHLAPSSSQYEQVRTSLAEAGLGHVPISHSSVDTVPEYRVELEEFIRQRLLDGTF